MVGSIPIRIHPFFWLLTAIIGWLYSTSLVGTLIWMVVIFISVLFHEYGHALTARFFGQHATISLVAFGGLTTRGGQKLQLWQEFLIVFNGPLFGFCLLFIVNFMLTLFSGSVNQITLYALNVAFYINLFWTLVNLLPAHPLDGGRLLSIILEACLGFRGVKLALLFSLIFCGALGLLFFSFNAMLPGALFFLLAFENYRSWQATRAMAEQDQNSAFWDTFNAIDVEGGDAARQELEALKKQSGGGILSVAIDQKIADILKSQGEENRAYQLLTPIQKKLSQDALIDLQQLAYRTGHYREAVALGQSLYHEKPIAAIAEINALSHALLGEARAAIGWLECLLRGGKENIGSFVEKGDFDPIRRDPLFIDWEAQQLGK